MEIKTKYNLGDKVWTIYGHKAGIFTVLSIGFVAQRHENSYATSLRYDLGNESGMIITDNVAEDHCFPTKEELIKSL